MCPGAGAADRYFPGDVSADIASIHYSLLLRRTGATGSAPQPEADQHQPGSFIAFYLDPNKSAGGPAGESKSYAERLFSFPAVGPLLEADAARALQDPVRAEGMAFEPGALHEIFRLTQGYPYFLQAWGYQAWNHAQASPIGAVVIHETSELASRRLDDNFFRVRFDRLTPRDKSYLRAMAELGPGPCRTGDVADKLGMKFNALGPVRASLIKKGMVYGPPPR